jgi:ribosomal protein S18 acetylase RimI-like enzyme
MRRVLRMQLIPLDISWARNVYDVQLRAFPLDLHETLSLFENALAGYPVGCFGVMDNGQLAGYLISYPITPDRQNFEAGFMPVNEKTDIIYLHDMAVDPEYRGRGVTSLLLSAFWDMVRTEGFKTVNLVAVNNAEGFWAKAGFTKVSETTYLGAAGVKMTCTP